VLVRHREISDPDHGGHYTVKIYLSTKTETEEGWAHTEICLEPDSDDSPYEPILLIPKEGDDDVSVLAGVVEVLRE
jgi:hypothetical protein